MQRVWGYICSGLLVISPSYSFAVDGAGFGWAEFLLLPFILPALFFGYTDTSKPSCSIPDYVGNTDGSYDKCDSPLTKRNANKKVGHGGSACLLQWSVLYSNSRAFDELINLGADPKLCEGYPDRFYEIARCDARIYESFQKAGIVPSNAQKVFLQAAKCECVPAVRIAIQQGADVNQFDEGGYSALYYVFNNLDTGWETASYLISVGADPFLPTLSGESPYEKAKRFRGNGAGWPELEQQLFSKRKVETGNLESK